MKIKKTRWSYYNLNYHFVWTPKYRRSVLTDTVAQFLEQVLHNIAEEYDIEILLLSVRPNYVYLSVSAPPRFSPAELANLFKGISAKKLAEQFPALKTKHGVWTRAYYVSSAGAVAEEDIRRYIEKCRDI
ncbi:MAG: IS200/IS605 family transposase [Thermoproteota archaeon]